MSILLHCQEDRRARWRAALEAALPGETVQLWPDCPDPHAVEVLIAARPIDLDLATLPKLRFVAGTGAGVEQLLGQVPADVPITRIVDPMLTRSMADYVLTSVLYHHRGFHHFAAAQSCARWSPLPRVDPCDRTVGILGMGALGIAAGERLVQSGFRVLGWSRRAKQLASIMSHSGPDGLEAMLGQTEILVCLLPLTLETADLVNRRVFDALQPGATFINVGRGRHVVMADLLHSLDTGRLAHAILDVFDEEPLGSRHPFWSHPRILVTPHIASLTVPETAVRGIAENLRRARLGLRVDNAVDRSAGY